MNTSILNSLLYCDSSHMSPIVASAAARPDFGGALPFRLAAPSPAASATAASAISTSEGSIDPDGLAAVDAPPLPLGPAAATPPGAPNTSSRDAVSMLSIDMLSALTTAAATSILNCCSPITRSSSVPRV
ncbi:hypothetical protein Vretifemale_11549 [Volvox reticuliferus]|uniref:Uncharacterized protein n=1 Tax=Volvox reticuliferus TaxID=1737510 RepID=A0A8J4FSM8_9CHLO|nr:hypothetical protein Vretifemale_11549 [Volvox reticuliferus]